MVKTEDSCSLWWPLLSKAPAWSLDDEAWPRHLPAKTPTYQPAFGKELAKLDRWGSMLGPGTYSCVQVGRDTRCIVGSVCLREHVSNARLFGFRRSWEAWHEMAGGLVWVWALQRNDPREWRRVIVVSTQPSINDRLVRNSQSFHRYVDAA